MPVQRTGSAHSQTPAGSDESCDGSTQEQDTEKSQPSIQYPQNSKAANSAPQIVTASLYAPQIDPKQSQSESNAERAESSESAADRPSRQICLNKPQFTAQSGSSFSLLASTVQPELSGMFFTPVAAAGSSASDSNPNASQQSLDSQSANPLSEKCSDAQPLANFAAPADAPNTENSHASQSRDGEPVSPAQQAARPALSQIALQPTSLDPSARLELPAASAEQSIAANADSNADSLGPANAAAMSQASLAAKTPTGSPIRSATGDLSQPAVKANRVSPSGSAFGLDSDTANSTFESKATKIEDPSNSSPAPHGVESTGPLLQHAQFGSAQMAGVSANPSALDSGQPLVIASQAGSHGLENGHALAGSSDAAILRGDEPESPATGQWVGSESAGMSGISAARLIQTMGETQMRVGMRSAEFGDISIRTAVSQQQMQTQISVDHRELGSALSAQIPAMLAKLGNAYGLQATIEVNQSRPSFSNDGERSQQHPQKSEIRPVESVEVPAALQSDINSLRGSAATSSEYRLDIRV